MEVKRILLVILLGLSFGACSSGGQSDPNSPPGQDSDPPPGAESTSRFFLPTDPVHNTGNPAIEIDAAGGSHVVYPGVTGTGAYYAYCAANCSSEEDMPVVHLDTGDGIGNVMIALDAGGHPQVLMSGHQQIHYASCSGDCRQAGSWTVTPIRSYAEAERDVSGEAFALDPAGRPRFLAHAHLTYLGLFAPEPGTWYFSCDADCHEPDSWQETLVATGQNWEQSDLQILSDGGIRVATVIEPDEGKPFMAYIECNADCDTEEGWNGAGMYDVHVDRYVAEIDPAISLALTASGKPRLVFLGSDESDERYLAYLACDATDCLDPDAWQGELLLDSAGAEAVGAGLDLALDGNDRPRFVYTARSNILLAYCNNNCNVDGDWKLTLVEASGDIEADEFFPYPNCTVGMWFLRHPSLGIAPDGLPRVAYRAEDISVGGPTTPDPTRPGCVAGVDMTLGRFAQLDSY
jgi:hypothetical protein